MADKLITPVIRAKISNQQSIESKNTLETGVEWQKLALKPTLEKPAQNKSAPVKVVAKKPAKSDQKKPQGSKPVISKPKSSEIDYSMVIAKGSTSSSGFPIITYTPRDPKNPNHRKAADAARQASGDQLAHFVEGAAIAIGTPVKAILDHTVGFAADALSQNHIEAAKKAQGIIAFGQAVVSTAGDNAGKALRHPEKVPYAVLIKPFVTGVQGIESGIETVVARSAAGDHNGAARALGGTVAMVPAVARGGMFAPKVARVVSKVKKRIIKPPHVPTEGLLEHGPTFPLDRIGEGRGQGSLKKVYEITNTADSPQVVGIRYSGFKAIGNIEEEVAILRHLKKLGFPTINNPSTMMLQKKHAVKIGHNDERVMIMDAYPKGSKNLRAETYFSQDEWNRIANKDTLDSFKLIRKKFIESNIHVGDCQYEILPNGKVILTDPMGIGIGFFQSDVDLLDKYIKMTEISLRKRKNSA